MGISTAPFNRAWRNSSGVRTSSRKMRLLFARSNLASPDVILRWLAAKAAVASKVRETNATANFFKTNLLLDSDF
jgi:hypothetical protein